MKLFKELITEDYEQSTIVVEFTNNESHISNFLNKIKDLFFPEIVYEYKYRNAIVLRIFLEDEKEFLEFSNKENYVSFVYKISS